MAENLIDLRRRIKSVKDTQKTTKAMKTVSAAKMRRSVQELNKTKPMMEKVASLLSRVSTASHQVSHPLLEERENGHTILVSISADKGLCGAFNSHLMEKTEERYRQMVEEEGKDNVHLITIGRKTSAYFVKRKYPIIRQYREMMMRLNHGHALDLSTYLQDIYLNGYKRETGDSVETLEIKQIEFVYTQYISAGRQELSLKQLFPIKADWEDQKKPESLTDSEDIEYIFEPSAEILFKALLPKYINSLVHQVLLQSSASEHAARMIAMDQATNAASDMIRSLTLTMNKLRQAAITTELLEIITATEALQK